MKNILTVDLEAWFNFAGIEKIYPPECWSELSDRLEIGLAQTFSLLEPSGSKATFFVLGYWAEQKPQLIKEILKKGYELAAHSFYHRLLYRQSPEEFRRDLILTLKVLEHLKGEKVLGFRAPEWSLRQDWGFEVLKAEGILYDSSRYPVWGLGNPRGGIFPHKISTTAGELWEFPPLVKPVLGLNFPLAGSLPLRLIPYSIIKRRIQQLNREGIPALIYFHPWELDPEIPRILLYSLRGLAHYAFLGQTLSKLKALLFDFNFVGIEEYGREQSIW